MGSVEGIRVGVVELPGLSLASLFVGGGIVILPGLLLYSIVSIGRGWTIWLSLICTPVMWWNIHKTVRWTYFDSPSAKTGQMMIELIDENAKRISPPEEARDSMR